MFIIKKEKQLKNTFLFPLYNETNYDKKSHVSFSIKKDFSDLNNFTIYNLLLIAKQLNIHNGKPKHLCYEELIESIKANIVFE
jgi:hypothetical protein